MHGLQACAVLILYVRAAAIISSVHSSTEDQVNFQALILFHNFSHTIHTATVVRLKKNIKWLCQSGECACTSPSFLFDPVPALFFFPLASDQTVPVVFYTVFFFLCEFAIKISRHITSCWCFHHFQYWIELLKNTHEKCFNDFYMRKRVAVKYCIYMFLCSWCYFVFFPAWTHILWALENHVELYFRQVLSWADCSSGQRSVALLRTALFLKGVGFDYLSHTETRRIRQHVLSSAHSQEAQLELATRWKILLINGCSNGLQFSGVQWVLAI